MKHKIYPFLALMFFFSACDNTYTDKKELTVIKKESPHQNPLHQREAIKTDTIPKPTLKEYTFTFEDLQGQTSTLKMKSDVYSFSKIQQPIVLMTLFATWCPPCRGQIPHISNLQKKFKKQLFIVGALVHDDINDKDLQKFINVEKALFFISKSQKENLKFANMIISKLKLTKEFPMPLIILFFKGKYFTHYEGAIPEEMIESDIEQLLLKLNN